MASVPVKGASGLHPIRLGALHDNRKDESFLPSATAQLAPEAQFEAPLAVGELLCSWASEERLWSVEPLRSKRTARGRGARGLQIQHPASVSTADVDRGHSWIS